LGVGFAVGFGVGSGVGFGQSMTALIDGSPAAIRFATITGVEGVVEPPDHLGAFSHSPIV